MYYQLRPGVILTEVCGEYLLVAAREARGKVAYARGLNSGGAYFWKLMEQGLSHDEIVAHAAGESGMEPASVEAALKRLTEALTDAGYILSEAQR